MSATHATTPHSPAADGPTGPYGSRLLDGWFSTGAPADLAQHLQRYGPPPLSRSRRGGPLIRAVDEAGLTGRGGAGFPTGRKLRTVADARGTAVVVANGMESEPASRKDRVLLDLAPHLVLDGMTLAAAAVGAGEIHLCLPARPRHPAQRPGRRPGRRAAAPDWTRSRSGSTCCRTTTSPARRPPWSAGSTAVTPGRWPPRRARSSGAWPAARPSSTTSRPWPTWP